MTHSSAHPGLSKHVNFTITLHFYTHIAHHQNFKKKLYSKPQRHL